MLLRAQPISDCPKILRNSGPQKAPAPLPARIFAPLAAEVFFPPPSKLSCAIIGCRNSPHFCRNPPTLPLAVGISLRSPPEPSGAAIGCRNFPPSALLRCDWSQEYHPAYITCVDSDAYVCIYNLHDSCVHVYT